MYKGPRQVQVVMMLENVNAKLKTLLEINVILVRQIIMDSQIAKVLFRPPFINGWPHSLEF